MYLQNLVNSGFELSAGYGNTMTDIRVYEKLNVPKSRTFISGSHKYDMRGAIAVGKNFVDHIQYLEKNIPPADPAFPVDSTEW